jgi:hypothetical protein
MNVIIFFNRAYICCADFFFTQVYRRCYINTLVDIFVNCDNNSLLPVFTKQQNSNQNNTEHTNPSITDFWKDGVSRGFNWILDERVESAIETELERYVSLTERAYNDNLLDSALLPQTSPCSPVIESSGFGNEVKKKKKTLKQRLNALKNTPHEVERIVQGLGTSIVKLSNGRVAVLLADGDLSLCDGNEWLSINKTGKRVAKPLFSFNLINLEDKICARSFQGVSFPLEIPSSSFSTLSYPCDEVVSPSSLSKLNTPDFGRSFSVTPERPTTTQTYSSKISPLFTPSSIALRPTTVIATQSKHLGGFNEVGTRVFPTSLGSVIKPASLFLTSSFFPTAEVLPPVASVVSVDRPMDAKIITRADRLMIVQHRTGEMVVHHADGTRVFHSWTLNNEF